MHDQTTTNRRQALAFASLAAALIAGGDAIEVRPDKTGEAKRPSTEDLARARSLFGGELGGFKGAR